MPDSRTPGFPRRKLMAILLAGVVLPALLATGTAQAASRQTGGHPQPQPTPPGPVTGFTAAAGGRTVTLRWTNPVSSTFQMTRILSRTDTWPTGPRDPAARVVYQGGGASHIDANLENLRKYYYKAYAYNYRSAASAPAYASATPEDKAPPTITALTGDSTATVWSSKEVRAGVTDAGGVSTVVLYYRQDNAREFLTAAMSRQSGSLYRGNIPSTAVEITPIQYYIQAWDFTGNTTTNPRSAPTTTHTITPQTPPRGSVNGYCRGCHGPGGSSGAQVDFGGSVTPGGSTVDRTACGVCHALSHYGYGGVSTAYGRFRSAASPFVDAKTAHVAHSVNRGDAMGCAFGCHNAAACIKCHTTVSHGGHGGLTQPYLRVGTAGESGEALVTCTNEACHKQLPDVLGEGWLYDGNTDQWGPTDDGGRPECLGCHTGALGHRSLHRAPTAGATACAGCHVIDLLGEHVDRRAIACSACHQSADSAVQAGISAGHAGAEVACFDCHGGGSTSIHDFTVVASDGSGTANQDSCIGCHVLSHFGYGGVSTAYGRFLSADSPSLDPMRIHNAHSLNRGDAMGCGYGCHNVTDCRICHDQVPHGNHSGRTEPYLRVNTAGETGTVLVPCANSACHGELGALVGDGDLDPSTGLWDNGASEAGQPQCANCHPWTNATFGR